MKGPPNQGPLMSQELLRWYRAHKRDLPWRRMEDNPYAVWVAEVMLQQTTVKMATPYFERWMERFPTLESLAEATLEEALKYWAGLGYYARARNLHRAARVVVEKHGGQMPSCESALSALPGVGRYTLGAIRSIAFNQPAPIVDANVARALSRVYAIEGDPKSPRTQVELWRRAEELIPKDNARDFNQALMELGALVCTPSDPSCERCPILKFCHAGNSPDPTAWPQIPPGKRTVRVTHACAALRQGEKILLIRRPAHGLWGGLWELPRRECVPGEGAVDCAARAALEVVGLEASGPSPIGVVKHAVTHHAIQLHGVEFEKTVGVPKAIDCSEVRWVEGARAFDLPLSAPQAVLLRMLMSRRVGTRGGRYKI